MGFIGNDGSELVGGLNPSGIVQAFEVDALGRILAGSGGTLVGSLSAGSLNADLVASMDVSAYRSFSLQVFGTWSGTLTVSGSNDNVNWNGITTVVTDNTNFLSASIFGNAMVYGPIVYKYLRVRMTGYSSGTAQATLFLSTMEVPLTTSAVVAAQGPAASSPWLITSNNDGTSTTAVAAATAANTVIKATAGRLARVIVTATGTANILIYDNATTNSGTVIGVIKSGAVVGDIYEFRMPAANGITVGGNVNNGGFTVAWV